MQQVPKKTEHPASRYYKSVKENNGEDHISSPCFTFPSILSPGECADILEWSEGCNLLHGSILASNDLDTVKQFRDSKVGWLPVEKFSWLYDRIYSSVVKTNFWEYDIDGFYDQIQFSEYDGKITPSFYNTHRDTGPGFHHRKISVVILLNDPEDFSGGEFELNTAGKVSLSKGSALMFPSFIEHRVHPVTEGKRYSLVAWISGPKLK